MDFLEVINKTPEVYLEIIIKIQEPTVYLAIKIQINKLVLV